MSDNMKYTTKRGPAFIRRTEKHQNTLNVQMNSRENSEEEKLSTCDCSLELLKQTSGRLHQNTGSGGVVVVEDCSSYPAISTNRGCLA
jgi:hypothetical protein